MASTTGTAERYSSEMGALWSGLARTLGRLEGVAAEPERLEDDGVQHALRRLQYGLHLAAEHAVGVDPPPGARAAHEELVDAIVGARDATAEVAEAVAVWGAAGVEALLHEWRGALFRVRLARLRLTGASARPAAAPPEERGRVLEPLASFLLALIGAVTFVAGATLGLWPLWVAGLLAVCGSVVVYRP
ncbi:MAG TPA: hypothetical protein VFA05_11425 [Gaiellaceae bacterium]|nr:hypothetical protein [Gaiellaceae bacterium]